MFKNKKERCYATRCNESAAQFTQLFEIWPPEQQYNILPQFFSILSDEEWYYHTTMEIPEVGSYRPIKTSSILKKPPTESELAKEQCKVLANQLFENILQQVASAEEFYATLSGALHD